MSTTTDTGMPRNAVTGDLYTGKNPIILLTHELEHGYNGHDWAGFKQWLSVGRVVRKGEHGAHCKRVISVPDRKTGKQRTACRGFVVFHRDQTEELEAGATPEATADNETPESYGDKVLRHGFGPTVPDGTFADEVTPAEPIRLVAETMYGQITEVTS